MIILDTNILSELMKPSPSERVLRWLDAQPAASLFTTTVTEAEIRYGLALLPNGKKRRAFEKAASDMFEEDFDQRILPFDRAAAAVFADVAATRRASGRPIAALDAQIAAIAQSRGAAMATRNMADFENCGITVIDPWSS